MNEVYILLPFVQFVVSVLLISLVLPSAPQNRNNILFSLFLSAMAMWGIAIFGMRDAFPDAERAYQIEKVALAIIPFSSVFFYHFVHSFTESRRTKSIVAAFYGIAITAAVMSLLGWTATGMERKFYGFAPEVGWAFPFIWLAAYPPVALSIWDLTKSVRKSSDPAVKTQLRLLRLGLLATVLGATSDYLPSFGLEIYPMGILGNIAFVTITTWAVTRHRLMNLRLVLRRGLAYVLLSAGVMSVYGITVGIVYYASRDLSPWAIGFAAVGAILATGLFIQPYYLRLQSLIDRIFFREKVDRLSALIHLNSELRDTMEFDSLVARLATRLRSAVQADWVAVMLPNRLEEELSVAYDTRTDAPVVSITADGILSQWLTDRGGPARASERVSDPFLQAMSASETRAMDTLDPQIIAPLIGNDRLTGMICIGQRIAGGDFSDEDLEFISSVASQSAMAVDNARLVSNEVSRLRELERLESLKSILLQTVSHELKSPLTAIKLSAEMIEHVLAGRGTVEQRDRLVTTLRHGIERLERLTGESLDYAAMQSAQLELEKEPMLLADSVKDAATLLGPAVEGRRQKLDLVADEGLGVVPYDRQRIERVISNLISNANKYSPEGTKITVRVFKELGSHVVTVTDEGPGIGEDEQEEIFSPYYRSKLVDGTSVRGSGLGLSIARYLVELHGGSLTVNSRIGHGSTFRLELPDQDTPPKDSAQTIPQMIAELDSPAEDEAAEASRAGAVGSSLEHGEQDDAKAAS